MSDRIPCCVPFCRRTRAAEKLAPWSEFICSDHWRLVDRRRRRVYAKAKRKLADRVQLLNWLWERLKAEAIEKAVGIA